MFCYLPAVHSAGSSLKYCSETTSDQVCLLSCGLPNSPIFQNHYHNGEQARIALASKWGAELSQYAATKVMSSARTTRTIKTCRATQAPLSVSGHRLPAPRRLAAAPGAEAVPARHRGVGMFAASARSPPASLACVHLTSMRMTKKNAL